MKFTAAGAVSWQRRYDPGAQQQFNQVRPTVDGGYIAVGIYVNAGFGDVWVVKTDSNGQVSWQNRYGGAAADEAFDVQQTSDLGYIVAGVAFSFPGPSMAGWVIKLDATGSLSWQRSYQNPGLTPGLLIRSVRQSTDGGYLLGGSYALTPGAGEGWLAKLDSAGNISWQRAYGGAGDDAVARAFPTADGGVALSGSTRSYQPNYDAWLIKCDGLGNLGSCNVALNATVGTSVTNGTSGATDAPGAVSTLTETTPSPTLTTTAAVLTTLCAPLALATNQAVPVLSPMGLLLLALLLALGGFWTVRTRSS